MSLNFTAPFQKKMNDLLVTKTRTEVERNVFFIVSGIDCLKESKQWKKLNNGLGLNRLEMSPKWLLKKEFWSTE